MYAFFMIPFTLMQVHWCLNLHKVLSCHIAPEGYVATVVKHVGFMPLIFFACLVLF